MLVKSEALRTSRRGRSSPTVRVAIGEAGSKQDTFTPPKLSPGNENSRVTSRNPSWAWSAIDAAFRALAKYHASVARPDIQPRRVRVNSDPTPLLRFASSTTNPTK